MLDAILQMLFELFGDGLGELFFWVMAKVLVAFHVSAKAVWNEILK